MSPRCCTRFRSSRTRPGREPTPPPPEICGHIEDMATRFDVHRHIQFGHEVNDLTFDEARGVWTVQTKEPQRVPRPHRGVGIRAAVGRQLSRHPGSGQLPGHKIHSARWDHDYDFTGKRVAVIGTGASAIQIIPELVKQAEFVKVFQRTPGWVLPRLDVRHAAGGASAVRQSSCRSTACAASAVLGSRNQCLGYGVEYAADVAGGAAGAGPYPRAGQRPVDAPPADPGLHAGLQAHARLQRLLPRAAAGQLQAHRLADRDAEPRRHPHQ